MRASYVPSLNFIGDIYQRRDTLGVSWEDGQLERKVTIGVQPQRD